MLVYLMFGLDWFRELVAQLDPARLAVSCAACAIVIEAVREHVLLAVGIGGAVMFVIFMLLFSQHSTVAIATPMVSIGQWLQHGRWSPLRWYFERRERAMQEKDLLTETSAELIEELVDFIESQRASTLWTDVQCDVAYNKLRKSFPIFRHAIDNPSAVKAVMNEEIANLRAIRAQRRAAAPAPSLVTRTRLAKA